MEASRAEALYVHVIPASFHGPELIFEQSNRIAGTPKSMRAVPSNTCMYVLRRCGTCCASALPGGLP